MKRTGFKRQAPERKSKAPTPATGRGVMCRVDSPVARASVPIPKKPPVVSEAYRRLVASFECIHCGVHGYSQAAHADEGKGMGMKSDDTTCYPACGPRLGIPGCHWLIGTGGHYTREKRRSLEVEYAQRTQQRVLDLGLWPEGVPLPVGFSQTTHENAESGTVEAHENEEAA